MKLKQGFVREDGMIFSQYYTYNGVKKELWYSKPAFESMLLKRKKRNLERQKINKKQHSENVKKWRIKNPDKAKLQSRNASRSWRLRNHHKAKINSTINSFNRKAKKLKQLHPLHDSLKEKMLIDVAKLLSLEVDHIVPLSRGGFHWHENLRLLPKSLNASKGKRLDSEMPERDISELMFWENLTKCIIKSFSC